MKNRNKYLAPVLNSQLYDYIESFGLDGKILTNYPLDYLPDLPDVQVVYWYQDLDLMLDIMEREEIGYLLYPSNSDESVQAWIDDGVASGKIHIIFSNSDYIPNNSC